MELYLYLAAGLIVPFAAELLILRLTRRRLKFLRFLLLLWPAFLSAAGWRACHADTLLLGLSSLAGLACLLLAALGLIGWALAWGVFALLERRGRNHGGE